MRFMVKMSFINILTFCVKVSEIYQRFTPDFKICFHSKKLYWDGFSWGVYFLSKPKKSFVFFLYWLNNIKQVVHQRQQTLCLIHQSVYSMKIITKNKFQ